MANSVGINDETMGLLKHVATKSGLSQAEAVKQGLIMYAESLGLVSTTETKVEVVKRTFELKEQPWVGGEPKH